MNKENVELLKKEIDNITENMIETFLSDVKRIGDEVSKNHECYDIEATAEYFSKTNAAIIGICVNTIKETMNTIIDFFR